MFTKLLAEHDDDKGEENEGEEVSFEFFIAGGDTAEWFEFVEETLDLVALLVVFLVVDDDIQAVRLGRDDRRDALGVELGAEGVAVIGLIHGGLLDALTRIDGLDDRCADRRIPHMPCRDADIHRINFGSTQNVDFRRQPAAGAAESLLAFFLAAPAAC